MLGVSAGDLDQNIAKVLLSIRPSSILEYGSGTGKLGKICQLISFELNNLIAVQKLFNENDALLLNEAGYSEIIDSDIYEFLKNGIRQQYDLIAALDVIEHFMFSDAISIIDYSLYYAKYVLLVWPSRYPQEGNNSFDIHRTSFELKELTDRFDIIYYSQTGFSEMSLSYRYHIALIRGHMNYTSMRPAII